MNSLVQVFQRLEWKKLTMRERVLWVVTWGVVFGVLFSMFWKPSRIRIHEGNAQQVSLKKEVQQLSATIKDLQQRHPDTDAGSEKRDVTGELSLRTSEVMPGGSRLSAYLEELTRLARFRQVEFVAIRPEGVQDKGVYLQLTLRIDVKSRFRELAEYLAMLESLPRAIVVEELSIESNAEAIPFIMGHLKAVTYLAKE
jgi:Tfp pilus assembly protein PilO